MMERPKRKIKIALSAGMLIILPCYLAFLLIAKLVSKLAAMMAPVTSLLPPYFDHPVPVAIVLLLLISVLVGIIYQTEKGKRLDALITGAVLEKIPGYSTFKALVTQAADLESADGFQPALIDVEDGCLSPAFLVEDHGDGRCTVFMPSVPTPMAGSIFIMKKERVFPIKVPMSVMMKSISKWGAGSASLLKAFDAEHKGHELNQGN